MEHSQETLTVRNRPWARRGPPILQTATHPWPRLTETTPPLFKNEDRPELQHLVPRLPGVFASTPRGTREEAGWGHRLTGHGADPVPGAAAHLLPSL